MIIFENGSNKKIFELNEWNGAVLWSGFSGEVLDSFRFDLWWSFSSRGRDRQNRDNCYVPALSASILFCCGFVEAKGREMHSGILIWKCWKFCLFFSLFCLNKHFFLCWNIHSKTNGPYERRQGRKVGFFLLILDSASSAALPKNDHVKRAPTLTGLCILFFKKKDSPWSAKHDTNN